MPQPEFALIDDYYYSFVLAYHIGADIVKLHAPGLVIDLPTAECP
jgi:hypothetical protein